MSNVGGPFELDLSDVPEQDAEFLTSKSPTPTLQFPTKSIIPLVSQFLSRLMEAKSK